MKTTFENRCKILSEFWISYKNDFEFAEFIGANDLGLPLSFSIHHKIIENNQEVTEYVNETWELFLDFLEEKDKGFTTLNEVIESRK